MDDLQTKIALSLIPGVGPRLVRRLVSYTGGMDAVFNEKKQALEKIPGIGSEKAGAINKNILFKEAGEEIAYTEKSGIKTLFYLDNDYPARLKECEDAPVVMYVKGEVDFNAAKIISVVGTRNATQYGKDRTEEIISYLAANYPQLIVVSGLAYGIDITAHKAALKNNLKTIAALGHGLQYLYPALNSAYAKQIELQGALVTEFKGDRKPDPGNFVSRNRIIAGLADASIIIESAKKGGALITADLANSYNREVFALPGRPCDNYSQGCNMLIKTNKAALAEDGKDIEFALGWHKEREKPGAFQKTLFVELSDEEQTIISFMEKNGDKQLDDISISLDMPVSKVSGHLLCLEFKGLIKSLPGKHYRKI